MSLNSCRSSPLPILQNITAQYFTLLHPNGQLLQHTRDERCYPTDLAVFVCSLGRNKKVLRAVRRLSDTHLCFKEQEKEER